MFAVRPNYEAQEKRDPMDRLNDYTRRVLDMANEIVVPEDVTVMVNASSEIVVGIGGCDKWVMLFGRGVLQEPKWRVEQVSTGVMLGPDIRWTDLQVAIDDCIAALS